MKILVINAGSSTLKYQLIDAENEKVLAKGNCERIGQEGAFIGFKTKSGEKIKITKEILNHTQAFEAVKEVLLDEEYGAIKDLSEVSAVGQRSVHGADYSKSALITDEVIADMKKFSPLAPIHSPAIIQGIEACKKVFGEDIPQVAVFDTAFHQTMPAKAYMYAIPYEYYEKYGIRKYGFHGSSHRYVSEKMAELMGKSKDDDLKLITCHIGSGSSIAAIKNGKTIDTTMGLTPLDGFMMGTRSGSLDPGVVTFLAKHENLSFDEIDTILNKKSGLLGVSGISSDDRDICNAEEEGNERARLAHEMLYYQIAKYIGSYYVALGGCDGIVFTAGLGENQAHLRERVCEYLTCFGVEIDKEFNETASAGSGITGTISTPESKIRVEVIATDEEMIIARDTKAVIEQLK